MPHLFRSHLVFADVVCQQHHMQMTHFAVCAARFVCRRRRRCRLSNLLSKLCKFQLCDAGSDLCLNLFCRQTTQWRRTKKQKSIH